MLCPVMRLCHFGESPYAAVGNARQAIARWRLRASISIRLLVVGGRVSRGLRLYADELKAEITDPVQESVKR